MPRSAPHALKGQKLLAQGNALGIYGCKPVALKGQKLSYTPKKIRISCWNIRARDSDFLL